MSLATPARLTRESSQGPSPAYSAGRRYSLYGSEDRVVLDLGSKLWKYGFSSDSAPRGVVDVSTWGGPDAGLWDQDCSKWTDEQEKQVQAVVQKGLRQIVYRALMLDPRQRKMVITEGPLLPLRIKNMIARVLFDNLQVPSISFVPSHFVALMASGNVTGLVVDCGHLETSVLPVFHSRPLFNVLHTTPRAGSRLHARLAILLEKFGRFLPPGALAPNSSPSPAVAAPIPREHLSYSFVEDLKTRILFVSTPIAAQGQPMDLDLPEETSEPNTPYDESKDVRWLTQIQTAYSAESTATDLSVHLPGGKGTVTVPGWVRERAAELFFEPGDEDEASLTETVLELLLKLPIDLRRTMASSILLVGGASMLPGFAARLEQELVRTLQSKHQPAPLSPRKLRRTHKTRFHPISNLHADVAVLNNPTPNQHPHSGSASAFSPHLLPWIGASLAVALKTSGEEITRDQWDDRPSLTKSASSKSSPTSFQMPDWTIRHVRTLTTVS